MLISHLLKYSLTFYVTIFCIISLTFEIFQVSVDTSVTDDSDDAWQTGPRHTLHVKSQEDPASKTSVSQAPRQVPPSQYAPSTSQGAPGPPPPGVSVLPSSQPGASGTPLSQLPQYNIPRPGT